MYNFKGRDVKHSLYADKGNDILRGGNGDDFLDGGLGVDTFTGGASKDTFNYADAIFPNSFPTRGKKYKSQLDRVIIQVFTLSNWLYFTQFLMIYFSGGKSTL
ncbi:hypothetical protein LC608_26750 [Nostoc sp. XA010]|uniref:hypothetical protein n=1 Tax=Nostoc sp. XA010 TaxID=2780407 RepID=UPI0035A97749|nr:hypothetical protein [Nostoc sp. XA010]